MSVVKNGDIRYKITYYDRNLLSRTSYLNNSTFTTQEQAEREVKLLKKLEADRSYKNRVRFKIEPVIIKNAINKAVK